MLRILTATLLILSPLATEAQQWRQYAVPESAGFSTALLESAFRHVDSVRSGAVFAVYRGNVIAAFGEATRKMPLQSVRKSLYSSLFGIGVASKKVNLDATVGSLGATELTALTELELRATLRDLLSARSGVYLPSAYSGSQDSERPQRGSHAPGSFFFYNNWDFNFASAAYTHLTGENVYHAFRTRLALPLGMEDYTESDGYDVLEPRTSRYPAQTFRMSARDLARFGELYRLQGRWKNRQIVPRDWIDLSTRPASDLGDGRGYGYMWWTYEKGAFGDRYPQLSKFRVFSGQGTGGQLLAVIPEAELVVVHQGDVDNGRPIVGRDAWRTVELILAAKTSSASRAPTLKPVQWQPLPSQAPAAKMVARTPIPESVLSEVVGDYEIRPGAIANVFVHEGRLFGAMPGLGDTELVADGKDHFVLPAVPLGAVVFERDSSDRVVRMRVQIARQTLIGTRR